MLLPKHRWCIVVWHTVFNVREIVNSLSVIVKAVKQPMKSSWTKQWHTSLISMIV